MVIIHWTFLDINGRFCKAGPLLDIAPLLEEEVRHKSVASPTVALVIIAIFIFASISIESITITMIIIFIYTSISFAMITISIFTSISFSFDPPPHHPHHGVFILR